MAAVGGLLIFLGLFALVVAVIGLVKQRVVWTRVIATRRDAALLLAGSLVVMTVGGAVSPQPAKVATSTPIPSATPNSPTPPTPPLAPAVSANGVALPDRAMTPGSVFPAITAGRLCVPGYSSTVRNVSEATRKAVFAAYHVDYATRSGYELDHLIPLELGGDNAPTNLWPQPWTGPGAADVKDHLENHLHDLVCTGQVPVAEAQNAMRGDWWAANAKYAPMTLKAAAPAVSQPPPAPAPPAAVAPAPRQVAPPAPAAPARPAPSTTIGAQTFANCTDMHNTYPHGVGLPGAVDHTASGKNPVTTFTRSTDLYNANSGSDADGDGIACEKH